MKYYGDKQFKINNTIFSVGDTVLVKQKKVNKLTPPFNPVPHIITSIKGTMITAKSTTNSVLITRNLSFFKKLKDRKSENELDYNELFEDDNISLVESAEQGVNAENEQVINVDAEEPDVEDTNDAEVLPRRNPPRIRNRPLYLRDDIENLISEGN